MLRIWNHVRDDMARRNRAQIRARRDSLPRPAAPQSTPDSSPSRRAPTDREIQIERARHRERAGSNPVPRNPPPSPELYLDHLYADDSVIVRDFQFEPRANLNADGNDASLQRYKESLGLGAGKDLSDPNDPRVCIILSLTMESPGRPPVTIDLATPGSEATLKDHPFKIKEGTKFTMVAKFKVQHEILSGLQYVQVVKRKGIRVSKDSEMLGSYAPNTDKSPTYVKHFQEEDAPSGMLARGHYNAVSTFVDDDKKKHLEFEWSFDIAKDW